MKEFRFSIGSADGPRSTVWKLWTSKAEFYLQSRMMGSSVKVSIHSGGIAQYSMESLWYGKYRPNQPNRDRHIERWFWEEPNGNAAAMVFRVCIPNSELRLVAQNEDLTDVTWLDAPGSGMQANIICYVSPAPLSDAPVDAPGFLCALERGNGSIVIFARKDSVTENDLLQMARAKQHATEWAKSKDHVFLPSTRMAALANDDDGGHVLIEFVPE